MERDIGVTRMNAIAMKLPGHQIARSTCQFWLSADAIRVAVFDAYWQFASIYIMLNCFGAILVSQEIDDFSLTRRQSL
jgi:hypothetical protein